MSVAPVEPEIDCMLERGAEAAPTVHPAVVENIVCSITGSLRPARRLPPRWARWATLFVGCGAVAFVGAAAAGFGGLAALGPWRGAAILTTLALLGAAVAHEVLARSIPGSRVHLNALPMLAGCCASLVFVYALMLHDYGSHEFVAAGLGCLEQGILHAIPAGLLGMILLRRGFAARPLSAALAGGALAALAGIGFLEMHCPNLEAAHRIVWHTAVLPLSAVLVGLGALIAGYNRGA